MKPLFTFLIAILFLAGCGQSDHQHSHDDDHSHAEGDGHHHEAQPEAPAGVRMGTGLMTFDTVPGWGLTADGKSAIGPTHVGVIVGKDGTVYTSADKGVIAFSPDGKVAREFPGEPYTRLHDIEIRDEGGTEYLYGARNANAEGIKFNAADGKVALRLPFPAESGLNATPFNPTAITVSDDGNIFLSDGYASNIIFIFDKAGKYLKHFGA